MAGHPGPANRLLARTLKRLSVQHLIGVSIAQRIRLMHVDHRARFSNIWAPSGGFAAKDDEDTHAKLVRCGILRQASLGLYHMLPMGQRIQEKLERLIDKHMRQIGASKAALSTLSSTSLWKQSGRLDKVGSELFQLTDRRHFDYLLAPTHEEEITSLVAKTVKSYKDLPLRVYQITRKYRDEIRPRQGILRAREFTMKDLYSFDMTEEAAMDAYEQVSLAYKRLFEELKLPVLVARASSGDMGGDMSHEYHLPSAAGDDTVISCSACKHTFNEEVPYTVHENNPHLTPKSKETQVWHGISKDRRTLVNVWYPKIGVNRKTKEKYELTHWDINVQAVKIVFPELDASVENPLALWEKEVAKSGDQQLRMVRILDSSINPDFADHLDHDGDKLETYPPWFRNALADDKIKISLLSMVDFPDWRALRPRNGDPCPACGEAAIEVHKAIELGHTFYLGKRYTDPFEATVSAPADLFPTHATTPNGSSGTRNMTLHMGCYGIGVSRIIGAVAEHFANGRDLRWPRAIAPYDVVIVSNPDIIPADAELVYDALVGATRPAQQQQQQQQQPIDVLLDDRHLRKFAWKLRDAFSLGLPVVIILGKDWEQDRLLEVQAKGLGIRQAISLEELPDFVHELLEKL